MNQELQENPAVCLIVVYFGPWPDWIDYFLLSCEQNPQFHWRIFSNCHRQIATPKNVFVHQLEKEQLEELVSRKTGTSFHLGYVYKLCDLKPTYGHLFSDYLNDYSFWGYTDLDVVYGNISAFIDSTTLDAFDIISASKRVLVGHFTLVRNTSELARLYQQCPGYRDKLCSAKYEVFDEKDFDNQVKSMAKKGELRLFEKEIQTEDCIIWWSGRSHFLIVWWHGKLFDLLVLRPLCYFHFIRSKQRSYFQISPPVTGKARFYVDNRGIHKLSGGTDYCLFVLSLTQVLIMTIPWYLKIFLKQLLPGKTRRRLRKIASQYIGAVDAPVDK